MRLRVNHLDDTLKLGRAIGAMCAVGDVVALDGELGAGKTQLVRGLAEGLGLDPRQVSSPTFVFMQEYLPASTQGDSPVLVHMDAYRLEGAEDLATLGWDDGLLDGAVLAVEWAERIADHLGPDRLQVTLEHAGDSARQVEIEAAGTWVGRMPALEAKLT